MSHLLYFNGKLGKLCGLLTSRFPWKPSVWLSWSFGVQPYFFTQFISTHPALFHPSWDNISVVLWTPGSSLPSSSCFFSPGTFFFHHLLLKISLTFAMNVVLSGQSLMGPSFSEFMWHVVSESPPFNSDSPFCLACLFNSWLSSLLPELAWNSLREEIKSLSLCPLSNPWSSETPSSGTRLWDQVSLHFSQIWFNYL